LFSFLKSFFNVESIMEIPISNFVATGGVTGAVVVVSYMIYKLCQNKKFKSSCCGASMEVREDLPTPSEITEKPKIIIRTIKEQPEEKKQDENV
jgi:hypothetical protein